MKIREIIISNIETNIELVRIRMIVTGKRKGLNHSRTLKYSKELDVLLNKYHRINQFKINLSDDI